MSQQETTQKATTADANTKATSSSEERAYIYDNKTGEICGCPGGWGIEVAAVGYGGSAPGNVGQYDGCGACSGGVGSCSGCGIGDRVIARGCNAYPGVSCECVNLCNPCSPWARDCEPTPIDTDCIQSGCCLCDQESLRCNAIWQCWPCFPPQVIYCEECEGDPVNVDYAGNFYNWVCPAGFGAWCGYCIGSSNNVTPLSAPQTQLSGLNDYYNPGCYCQYENFGFGDTINGTDGWIECFDNGVLGSVQAPSSTLSSGDLCKSLGGKAYASADGTPGAVCSCGHVSS